MLLAVILFTYDRCTYRRLSVTHFTLDKALINFEGLGYKYGSQTMCDPAYNYPECRLFFGSHFTLEDAQVPGLERFETVYTSGSTTKNKVIAFRLYLKHLSELSIDESDTWVKMDGQETPLTVVNEVLNKNSKNPGSVPYYGIKPQTLRMWQVDAKTDRSMQNETPFNRNYQNMQIVVALNLADITAADEISTHIPLQLNGRKFEIKYVFRQHVSQTKHKKTGSCCGLP